jgi:hypothetical protein
MVDIVKDKFKVTKYEEGIYAYDTIFIDVNKQTIQIPIIKGIKNVKQIVGKTILIPCELVGENNYLFNKEITQIEYV